MADSPVADALTAAVGGDTAAFAARVRKLAGPLLQIVRRVEGDVRLAEAIVRDAIVLAWRHRVRLDRPRRFKLALYRFALLRGQAADARQYAPQRSPAADDPALAAVDEVPPRQRAVFLLRVWERLSYDDIGYVLAVSEQTARSEMHLALLTVRDSFRHVR